MPDLNDIDLSNVPPSDFEPIPASWYRLMIDESERKSTKDMTGEYINCKVIVLGPTHTNRVLFARFNLWNTNPEAVNIAKRQFVALAEACGKPNVKRTEELHGIPFEGKVTVRPARGEYEASNDIKAYRPAQKTAAPVAPAAQKAAPPAGVPWQA